MWETLCRGYSVNLQCEDSSCLPCGWSIAWFPQIHADFHRFYMNDKNRNPPTVFFVAVRTHKNQDKHFLITSAWYVPERIDKNRSSPVRLVQGSYETWMAQPSGNP